MKKIKSFIILYILYLTILFIGISTGNNINEYPLVWNQQRKDIIFRNGYGNDKPEFTAEVTISEGYGNEEWGAENGCKYYVLKIHRVYNEKNIAKKE